jgi:hypothetical protein
MLHGRRAILLLPASTHKARALLLGRKSLDLIPRKLSAGSSALRLQEAWKKLLEESKLAPLLWTPNPKAAKIPLSL